MKGPWEIEDFADAETEVILELLNVITDSDGDFSG